MSFEAEKIDRELARKEITIFKWLRFASGCPECEYDLQKQINIARHMPIAQRRIRAELILTILWEKRSSALYITKGVGESWDLIRPIIMHSIQGLVSIGLEYDIWFEVWSEELRPWEYRRTTWVFIEFWDDEDFVKKKTRFSQAYNDEFINWSQVGFYDYTNKEVWVEFSNRDDLDRLLWKMYWFPQTAVEAFIVPQEGAVVSRKDSVLIKDKAWIDRSLVRGFRFSKKHQESELAVLVKWQNLIRQYAPELIV